MATYENDPLGALGSPATFSFPSGGYEIADAMTTNTPPALGPARAGSLREQVSYSNFSVTYDVVKWTNTYNPAFGATVPEPSACALLALAGLTVGWKVRQARRRTLQG